eukprot:scaffold65052_cov20-Tisochrysis_lutea.AAC.3
MDSQQTYHEAQAPLALNLPPPAAAPASWLPGAHQRCPRPGICWQSQRHAAAARSLPGCAP